MRIIINNENLGKAEQILDKHLVKFDLDGGNRFMVSGELFSEAAGYLEEAGLKIEIV